MGFFFLSRFFHSKFVTPSMFKFGHHVQHVVQMCKFYPYYLLMMVAFVFDYILFVPKVCLPHAEYAIDFNYKLVFDGIHIQSYLLLPILSLFIT